VVLGEIKNNNNNKSIQEQTTINEIDNISFDSSVDPSSESSVDLVDLSNERSVEPLNENAVDLSDDINSDHINNNPEDYYCDDDTNGNGNSDSDSESEFHKELRRIQIQGLKYLVKDPPTTIPPEVISAARMNSFI